MGTEHKNIDIQILTRSIAGEASADELKELELWLARSEANRKEYEQLKKTWDALDKTQPGNEINIDREWAYHQQLLRRASAPVRSSFRSTILKIAAGLILLIGIGVLWVYLSREEEPARVQKKEQIRTLHLADGSTVTLNIGSSLDLAIGFGKTNREMSLKGEAYFEVAHDSTTPFIIHMGTAAVEVLGTSFNIRAYDDQEKIEVTVAEGRVSLYDKENIQKKVVATVGERAEYARTDRSVTIAENTDKNFLAWKTRVMVFDDLLLPQVIDVLERVYHRKITIDPALSNCRFKSSFDDVSLDKVLAILISSLNLTRTDTKQDIHLSGPGCD